MVSTYLFHDEGIVNQTVVRLTPNAYDVYNVLETKKDWGKKRLHFKEICYLL